MFRYTPKVHLGGFEPAMRQVKISQTTCLSVILFLAYEKHNFF